jgi:hypothetical protein
VRANAEPAFGYITLAWDPVPPDVENVRVYYGHSSRDYEGYFTVPAAQTSFQILDAQRGEQYFFAATSVTSEGIESVFSEEVSWPLPKEKRLVTEQ